MNRQSNKITALYCRIASYHQDFDASIARNQIDRLLLYAKEHGLQKPQLFCDWGFSGTTQDRPEYQRMIREIKAGNVSALVVLDFSRLGRSYAVCRELFEEILPQHKVTIHSVKDHALYTPQDLTEMAERSRALEAFCRKSPRKGGRK